MIALSEILEWSKTLPYWQQDALRRLLEKNSITDDDVIELAELCKKEKGVTLQKELTAIPLDEKKIPVSQSVSHATALLGIENVQAVNAISSTEKIKFAPQGITIIYGNNGAGKSGYSRIIKNITRSRIPETILPNVFEEKGEQASASIDYCIDGTLQPQILWKQGENTPKELSEISFFDSDCAQEYVEKQTSVAYRPFGLDLFDKLAQVCDQVSQIVQNEISSAQQSLMPRTQLSNETATGKFLENLSADTTEEEITKHTLITKEETEQVQKLRELIGKAKSPDLPRQIQSHLMNISSITNLLNHIHDLQDSFSPTSTTRILSLKANAVNYKKAADLAAQQSFAQELPGVGKTEWRIMWDAAREYSEKHAYIGHKFPHVKDDAKCPLCQQTLSPEARTRLVSFEKFVQDVTARNAKTAQQTFQLAKQVFEKKEITPEYWKIISVQLDKELVTATDEYFAQAEKAFKHIAEVLEDKVPFSEITLTPPPDDNFRGEIEKQKEKIEAIKKIQNPQELQKDEAILREYDARVLVSKIKDQLLKQISTLKNIRQLTKCIKSINTAPITLKSNELTKKYITQALCDRFSAEIARLRLSDVKVQLIPSEGRKGVAYHQIQLQTASGRPIHIEDILSEGEHRCVALAGFLTELATADHKSGIVLDDPVSSLDHNNRDLIAQRLVEEAKERQVIIFTHDTLFLMYILEIAQKEKVTHLSYEITKELGVAGIAKDNIPWEGMEVSKRLGVLKDKWQKADAINRKEGADAYQMHGMVLYGKLRETWERAIEEVLLGDVVQRMRKSVETQRLRKVIIEKTDYEIIEHNMAKCSTWMAGHDAAAGTSIPFPLPSELLGDITLLDEWVKEVRKRTA